MEKYKEIEEEEAERQTSKCSKRVFSVRISAVFSYVYSTLDRLMPTAADLHSAWCMHKQART